MIALQTAKREEEIQNFLSEKFDPTYKIIDHHISEQRTVIVKQWQHPAAFSIDNYVIYAPANEVKSVRIY